MDFIIIGINYKNVPLSLRENAAFSRKDMFFALQYLLEKDIAQGAVILSTCQRAEIYAQAKEALPLKEFFRAFKKIGGISKNSLYVKQGDAAVHHLFAVAAGLDSRIIGENEILCQVREAYRAARAFEATTPFLNKVFERALFAGRYVRQNTRLSKGNPSVAGSSVELAEHLEGGLAKKNVFVIGSGIVAKDVAIRCAQKEARCTIVAGRSFSRALTLAQDIGGRAVNFEEFYRRLDEADILFSATASHHIILEKQIFCEYRRALKPLLIVDLAVPRDVDETIGRLANIRLLNVDDFMDEPRLRNPEIEKAYRLAAQKARRFIWKLNVVSSQACKEALFI